LQLAPNVVLTGRLDIHAVSRQLLRADIGVAPYCGWMEFSGLKLFDYKAAGLAIVASGHDGQPPTLQHGKTAWIVPPCEPEALAEAILRLSDDPELRRAMSRAARLEAEECHSWRHTVIALEQIFAGILTS
jgi:glycosyltransferase involved in cell wall biosynthesis